MANFKRYKKQFFISLFLILSNIYIFSCSKNEDIEYIKEKEVEISISSIYNKDTVLENAENSTEIFQSIEEKSHIFVFIYGEINKPDVYEIEDGLRIIDLIELAGGFTDEANTSYHNLAAKLKDEQRIYIPKIGEELETILVEDILDTNKNNSFSKININTASKEELLSLAGIGKSKAEQIIEYRSEHGKFKNIEDIMKIKGIKSSAFEKIKDKICVD